MSTDSAVPVYPLAPIPAARVVFRAHPQTIRDVYRVLGALLLPWMLPAAGNAHAMVTMLTGGVEARPDVTAPVGAWLAEVDGWVVASGTIYPS